ncbi:MAG TPA: hypothetical protein VNM47_01990 [Terriglobia bacterium]|nr:hypothetical protein [Terriglobia bacterium]
MLNQPTMGDISIASQKKRRLLVTATYTIVVAFAAAILIRPSWVHESGSLGRFFLLLVIAPFVGVVPILFSYLAKLPLPLSGFGGMTRVGQTPEPRDRDDLDECQLAIRNEAHYQAFRFVIVYSCVLFVASMFLGYLNDATAHRLLVALTMLLFFMVWSLPQAIILWTKPDAPEEVQTYS